MKNDKIRYDPRFYFISINSFKLFRKPKEKMSLLFRLGTKISQSKYQERDIYRDGDEFQLKKEQKKREIHILKYGAEQFLNIYFKSGIDHEGHNSYSRILLPPLFQRPHTKHNVTVKLFEHIFDLGKDQNEEVAVSGQLNIDIYFQFNFQGTLEVIPVSAQLERNIAQIGQMKPKVRLYFQEESWCSLEAEGGIRPHWTGHFHLNSSNPGESFMNTIVENLKCSKLEQWERAVKMASNNNGIASNQKEKEKNESKHVPYYDCTSFKMKSAGSYLKVELISDPFIGSKPDIIGTANIRVEDEGLLKFPRKQQDRRFEEKLVNMYHLEEITNEKVFVGVLKLYVRFVFDAEKITKKDCKYSLL